MVKVVGKDKQKVKRVTCSNCASKLEYTPSEAEQRSYTCCGKPESGMFITCPTCNQWVEVS